MRERQDIPAHYHGIRRLLSQLAAFAEAACHELGPESPLVSQFREKRWMAQVQDVQRLCCERCGARFDDDLLGSEAYAVHAFQRICAACYAELVRSVGRPTRRLARLTAFAQEHPELMANYIVQAQRRRQLTDPELQHWLGINAIGVLRLALCRQPRPDYTDEDIAALAASAGCTTTVLRAILAESGHAAVATSPTNEPIPERMRSSDQDAGPDRVAQYHQLVRAIVQRIAAAPGADQDAIERLFICDAERGHYIHMTAGWHNHYPMYATIVHVRINKDGKIVIEHDGTDTFGDQLRAAGVSKDDIVFGFLPPELAVKSDE